VQAQTNRQGHSRREPSDCTVLLQPLLHAQGREHGPPGVVFLRYRGAKQGHKPVVEPALERTPVALDLGVYQRKKRPQGVMQCLGVQAFGQRHCLAQPASEDGDGLDLPGHGWRHRRLMCCQETRGHDRHGRRGRQQGSGRRYGVPRRR